jgi:ArsR family transcriptional regulator, arsenate/arsenite/antimonite-responsive transcriptional repressor / arsenate reductase (thioredoxin)
MSIEVSIDTSTQDRARVHSALADPIRVAIVDALWVSDRSPSELGRSLEVPSPLMAHHLRVLEEHGVIERRRSIGDGRRAYFRLLVDRLQLLVSRQTIVAESVIFVCTHNSARSQLAAAMWNRSGPPVRADSAGTHPSERVHPKAILVGRQHGLDLSGAVPRLIEASSARGTLLVSVCDHVREELGDRVGIHWSVPDPALVGTDISFEAVADEIERRVERLKGTTEFARSGPARKGR